MSKKPSTGETHRAWRDLIGRVSRRGVTRRDFVRGAALGAAGLAGWPILRGAAARAQGVGPATPGLSLPDQASWGVDPVFTKEKIKHVVVLCQENRSFDHYFGRFANSELGNVDVFDPNQAYVGSGTTPPSYKPFHLEYFCDYDPDHGWDSSHIKWNGGAMDGWVQGEPNNSPFALGYYDAADHIYHVQLAQTFTIADQYFCSQISQTLPNRLYLWTGTSGWNHLDLSGGPDQGLPYNNPSITEVPPVLDWLTMAEVLEAKGLPWACYSVADGSVPSPIGAFNPLIFFKNFQENPQLMAKALLGIDRFFLDLALGQLPAVSWIVTQAAVSEHPPAPPDMGQLLAARVIRALMESTAWDSTALFLTYDEGGGYFDHVAPPILESVPSGSGAPSELEGVAVGPAFRVPFIVASPWARRNYIFKDASDHTSVLKFIEKNFQLPHDLDIAADRWTTMSDLSGAFDFTQLPTRPLLPAPEDLFKLANETILTSDVHRGIVECGTTVPRWLPPLLGQDPLIPFPTPKPA